MNTLPLRGSIAIVLALTLAVGLPDRARAQEPPSLTMGRDVVIASGQEHDGDLLVVGGDLAIEEGAVVLGDAAVAFGDATIAGRVAGDVWSSGELALLDTAVVERDAAALGRIDRAAGAQVGGQVLVPRSEELAGRQVSLVQVPDTGARAALGLAAAIVVLAGAFAALATALAPGAIGNVRTTLERAPWRSFLLGLVATVLLPFALFALLGVLVLVPVALFLWLVVLAIGGVGLAERVGGIVLGARAGRSRRALLGGLIVAVPVAAAATSVAILNELEASGIAVLLTSAGAAAVSLLLSFFAAGAGLLSVLGLRARKSPATDVSTGSTVAGEVAPPAVGSATQPAADAPEPAAPSLPTPEEGSPLEPAIPAVSAVPPVMAPSPAATRPADPSDPRPLADASLPDDRTMDPGPTPDEVVEALGSALSAPGLADEAVEPAGGPVAPGPFPAAEEPSTPSGQTGPQADVRHVPGLGPIYAHILRGAGYPTVGSLASASAEELLAALSVPGVQGVSLETVEAWIASARTSGQP